jgi:hypothetical protein
MRGSRALSVVGDNDSRGEQANGRESPPNQPRLTRGSDSSSDARSTAWEDVVLGDQATGQHASYRVEPDLDYLFEDGFSRFKVMAGAFNQYECSAGCSQYSEVELIARRALQAG